jgi:hypothetical protein
MVTLSVLQRFAQQLDEAAYLGPFARKGFVLGAINLFGEAL